MSRCVLITINVHGTGPEQAAMPQEPLYGRYAHGRYTYRVGLARQLDLLKDMDIRATFFWPVVEALRAPALLERCLREGHEVASHGNAFENHEKLGDREAEILAEAHAQLTALCGAAPAGFRAPGYLLSLQTLPLLQRLGYRYDASFVDDDAPYLLAQDGAPDMVELPWNEGLRDASHFGRRYTQARAEAFMREEFDALIEESGYACITLHPRADIGTGRSARIEMIRNFLDRARRQFEVDFLLCRELAEQTANARAP